MNIFDTLKNKVFDTVTNVMGYDAVWVDSVLLIELKARVGYKDPSEKQELSGIGSWNPEEPFMEYRKGFFDDLKNRVDNGCLEYVIIEGKGLFAVVEVQSKFDGDSFMARLRHTT